MGVPLPRRQKVVRLAHTLSCWVVTCAERTPEREYTLSTPFRLDYQRSYSLFAYRKGWESPPTLASRPADRRNTLNQT